MSRPIAVPRSRASTSQTFACTRYGTTYCSGPSVSYGKNASSDSMIAVPERNIGPAGAILIHLLPNSTCSAATIKTAITTKSHIHVHEYTSWTPNCPAAAVICSRSPFSKAYRYAMAAAAIGTAASMRRLAIASFNPTSSATTNTSPNRYPPRPSFQLHAIDSGYARTAKSIGPDTVTMPRIRLQLCMLKSPVRSHK